MKQSLKIIYEDGHLIVVEKPEGMLSVSTSRGLNEVTAHSLLNEYLNNSQTPRGNRDYNGERGNRGAGGNRDDRGNKGERGARGNRRNCREARVYIVHRLDRETSGIMVFAKSEEVKHLLQENWENAVRKRGYVAILNCSRGMTPGPRVKWEADEKGSQGRITSWLKENSAFTVYSSARDNGGQLAITNFKMVDYNPQSRRALMELSLDTGRKNQIRVHMQEMGTPIYGDKKYFGENESVLAENKKARRLYLHAYALDFIHPITGKEMKFSTGIPRGFIAEISASTASGKFHSERKSSNRRPSEKRPAGKKPSGRK